MHKKTIGEVIADQIADDIRSGRRRDVMPTETDLAEEFKVARGSVRIALKMVETLGLIGPAVRGHAREIVFKPVSGELRQAKRIGVFSRFERRLLSSSSQMVFYRMRKGFELAGYGYEFFTAPATSGSDFSGDKVSHYCRQYDADLWIVLEATDVILSTLLPLRKPVIALGGKGELLSKCHVLGYRGGEILAHATHLIHRRGHRRWVCPTSKMELCSTDALIAAFKGHPEWQMEDVFFAYEDANRDSLVACLNRIWSRRKEKPTLIVSSNDNLVTILSWLNLMRLKVPDDISLLNIGDDAVVFNVIPDMDHYSMGPEPISKKLLLLVRDLLIDPQKTPEEHRLIGDYVSGQSIRQLSE